MAITTSEQRFARESLHERVPRKSAFGTVVTASEASAGSNVSDLVDAAVAADDKLTKAQAKAIIDGVFKSLTLTPP
jgi:hypothetical protein